MLFGTPPFVSCLTRVFMFSYVFSCYLSGERKEGKTDYLFGFLQKRKCGLAFRKVSELCAVKDYTTGSQGLASPTQICSPKRRLRKGLQS